MKGKRFALIMVSISLLLVLAIGIPFASACGPAKTYKIGITQIVSHPALDAAREGFIRVLADEGFVEGENVEYIIRNAAGDMTMAASIAALFVAENVDLILSIATPTSQAVVAAVEGTDIPVVFNSVTEPVAAGLVDSWEEPGGNVTGISDMAPVEPQIELIMEIAPDTEKLGVVYNAGEVNSVVQIDMLNDIVDKYGLTVVEATAASTADVLAAAQSLVGRVDTIWVPADNTAVAAFEAIVGVGEQNGIPVFAADVSTVERGAIGCYGLDYDTVGEESGKLAVRILRGKKPADIPVGMVPMDELYFNTGAAERMGVTIPQALLDKATEIIE